MPEVFQRPSNNHAIRMPFIIFLSADGYVSNLILASCQTCCVLVLELKNHLLCIRNILPKTRIESDSMLRAMVFSDISQSLNEALGSFGPSNRE